MYNSVLLSIEIVINQLIWITIIIVWIGHGVPLSLARRWMVWDIYVSYWIQVKKGTPESLGWTTGIIVMSYGQLHDAMTHGVVNIS